VEGMEGSDKCSAASCTVFQLVSAETPTYTDNDTTHRCLFEGRAQERAKQSKAKHEMNENKRNGIGEEQSHQITNNPMTMQQTTGADE